MGKRVTRWEKVSVHETALINHIAYHLPLPGVACVSTCGSGRCLDLLRAQGHLLIPALKLFVETAPAQWLGGPTTPPT